MNLLRIHALVGIYFSQAYRRRQSLETVDNITAYEKCRTVLKAAGMYFKAQNLCVSYILLRA